MIDDAEYAEQAQVMNGRYGQIFILIVSTTRTISQPCRQPPVVGVSRGGIPARSEPARIRGHAGCGANAA